MWWILAPLAAAAAPDVPALADAERARPWITAGEIAATTSVFLPLVTEPLWGAPCENYRPCPQRESAVLFAATLTGPALTLTTAIGGRHALRHAGLRVSAWPLALTGVSAGFMLFWMAPGGGAIAFIPGIALGYAGVVGCPIWEVALEERVLRRHERDDVSVELLPDVTRDRRGVAVVVRY